MTAEQIARNVAAGEAERAAGRPLVTLDELLHAVPCDECPAWTTDPVECSHDRVQCPECREYGEGCVKCARGES